MRTIYNASNEEIMAEDDQLELMLAAGFTEEPSKPEAATPAPTAKPTAAPAK